MNIIQPPYSIVENADGIEYTYVDNVTSQKLYYSDSEHDVSPLVGSVVLNEVSQLSGIGVTNRTSFTIYEYAIISPVILLVSLDGTTKRGQ